MRSICLPSRIELSNLLTLCTALGSVNNEPAILIDLTQVRFFELVPMTFLLGKISGWVNSGKEVRITNPEGTRVGPYMERMDFYARCGVVKPESFNRLPARGRFMEFKAISRGSTSQATHISTQVADVLAPDQADSENYDELGFYDALQYSVSELVLNTVQHAMGNGFVGAQYYGARDKVQLAIADTGIGIRESFVRTESPYANQMKNDEDAVRIALENGASRTAHLPEVLKGEGQNAGVGLTFMTELAKHVGGNFAIVSGNGCCFDDNLCCLGNNEGYSGTFAAFSFPRTQLDSFHAAIELVKVKFLDPEIETGNFEGVFG